MRYLAVNKKSDPSLAEREERKRLMEQELYCRKCGHPLAEHLHGIAKGGKPTLDKYCSHTNRLSGDLYEGCICSIPGNNSAGTKYGAQP